MHLEAPEYFMISHNYPTKEKDAANPSEFLELAGINRSQFSSKTAIFLENPHDLSAS
jgi:hypothetical protein